MSVVEEQVGAAIESIETQGYARLKGVYSERQMDEALERVEYWNSAGRRSEKEKVPRLDLGQDRVYNIHSKESLFLELLFSSREIETILHRFLSDQWYRAIPEENPNYIMRGFSARSSVGRLPLHIDSFIPFQGPYPVAMQVMIYLEDSTPENGCSVVVPGSHQEAEYCTQDDFESAVPVPANKGDVIIWDSRLWHGALENSSERSRWSLIATFSRWWMKQAFNITGTLPEEIYQGLSEKEKAILGFCSLPFDSEVDGIDAKQGYDSLADSVSAYRRCGEAE